MIKSWLSEITVNTDQESGNEYNKILKLSINTSKDN